MLTKKYPSTTRIVGIVLRSYIPNSGEVDEELDFLDSPEDVEELEEFDEEDDEDEDSKLALQISKLLSEEDEAMMEEELDDL